MSEPKTSDPSHSFDPTAAYAASQQAMHKLMADAHARAQAIIEQYASLEAQMIARASQAIESWAELAQDAMAYGAQLAAQARKLGLETARKMSAGA